MKFVLVGEKAKLKRRLIGLSVIHVETGGITVAQIYHIETHVNLLNIILNSVFLSVLFDK